MKDIKKMLYTAMEQENKKAEEKAEAERKALQESAGDDNMIKLQISLKGPHVNVAKAVNAFQHYREF